MIKPLTQGEVVRTLAAIAIVCSSALLANAQIGSGWTQYAPTKKQDVRGTRATYSNSGGVETFTIYPGDQRSETRVNNDYTSGQRQFEGMVKVTSGTTGTTVYQTFGGSSTATGFMLVAHSTSGGQLRHYDNEVMVSGIYGVWVRWNTIHDANANKITAYVNGSNKGTFADHGDATHYNKYGVYNIAGSKSQSQWKSTKFWRK
jgi:hypothetical protein